MSLQATTDLKTLKACLAKNHHQLSDLPTLLSSTARENLELLAQKAEEITRLRHGRTVQLFAPLYLSNYCVSKCTYCGFSFDNQIPRRTLTATEVLQEARLLLDQGHRHILLVAGEHPKEVSQDYLIEVIETLKPEVPSLSIEVQTLNKDRYQELSQAGCEGVVIYQESYDRQVFDQVHVSGWKANFNRRYEAPFLAAEAGIRHIGLGVLYGLAEPIAETRALAQHLDQLMKQHWQSIYSAAFPRLRPATGLEQVPYPVDDRTLAQCIAALRILFPDLILVLSTRESAAFRMGCLSLGVNQLSAGSRTAPGAYHQEFADGEQFSIEDERSLAEVQSDLKTRGFDPMMKNWEHCLHG